MSRLDKIMKSDLNEQDAADLIKALGDKAISPMVISKVLEKRNIIIHRSAVDRWRKSKGIL